MYCVIYALTRDTGRRPNEVVSLHLDCLQFVDGSPTLIWNNHKRRRLGRRLPIHASTADIITGWQQRRAALPQVQHTQELAVSGPWESDPRDRRARHRPTLPGQGLPRLDRPDRRAVHRRHGPVRATPGDQQGQHHRLRITACLRATARRQRHPHRRSARADGPPIGRDHDGLLHDHPGRGSSRPSTRSRHCASTGTATRTRSRTRWPTSGSPCRFRSATASSRATSRPAANTARSDTNAPAAASTGRTPPT